MIKIWERFLKIGKSFTETSCDATLEQFYWGTHFKIMKLRNFRAKLLDISVRSKKSILSRFILMDFILLHALRMIPAHATREQDDANTIINDDIGYTVDGVELSENVEVSERR